MPTVNFYEKVIGNDKPVITFFFHFYRTVILSEFKNIEWTQN